MNDYLTELSRNHLAVRVTRDLHAILHAHTNGARSALNGVVALHRGERHKLLSVLQALL